MTMQNQEAPDRFLKRFYTQFPLEFGKSQNPDSR